MTSISAMADTNTVLSSTSGISSNSTGEDLSQLFITLLVAQISNQNPLDPTSGTEYVSQLAEFANVESLSSIRSSALKSVSIQNGQSLLQATSLIGQQVDVAAETILLDRDRVIEGSINLGEEVDQIHIRLYDSDGNLVEEQYQDFTAVGTIRFAFDTQEAGGYYLQADTITDDSPTPIMPMIRGEVERVSVGQSEEDILLQIDGLGNFYLLDTNQMLFSTTS